MRLVYFLVLQCLCISLNAQPVSKSSVGGLSDADVNDPKIKNVAAFALSEIDRRQNSAFKQVLVQILSAKTQVVAGVLYHLRLEVGASNCRKGKDTGAKCTLKQGSNKQVCDVQVLEKPWLNERKVTKVSCSGKTSRRKRAPLAGGLSDADVNDESVKNAADFALTEVEKRSNSAYKQTLVKILSAKKQVVAGTLYHLQLEVGESSCEKGSSKSRSECTLREGSNNQICTVKVWDRPWLNKKEVTEVKCSAKSQRRRREILAGGIADADINEDGVKSAADFALTEVEERSNSAYRQTLVQILSAKKQVVAGTLYHLQLEVGESNCDKGSSKSRSECTLREGSNNQVCTVKVWDRPWLNKKEVTEVNCSTKSERRRREAPDVIQRVGHYDADTDDVDIKSTAVFAVTEINRRQNSANKLLLVKILSAQSQVVEGSLHHLKLEIGESSCTNTNSGTTSGCTLKQNSNNQVCDVQVWDRPWLNKREITELRCSAKSDRRRRAALPSVPPGGLEDADVNYEDVKNAAAFAVCEINKQQDSEYKLILDEIVSVQTELVAATTAQTSHMDSLSSVVTTLVSPPASSSSAPAQIVSGTIYYLGLKLGQSNCRKGNDVNSSECTVQGNESNQICSVQVYEVPWENKLEASNINCVPISKYQKKKS